MKSPVNLLRSLLTDVKRLHPGVRGLDRDIITIEKRVEHEGFSFLSKAIPTLSDALLVGLSTGVFTCPIGFKTVKGGRIPRLFSGIFCDVFDMYTGLLKDECPIDCITTLYQCTRLFKKCLSTDEESDKLSSEAVKAFFDTENEIVREISDERLSFCIDRVSQLILGQLAFSDDVMGKHGPGAVYEGYSTNQKWKYLTEFVIGDDTQALPGYDDFALEDRIDLSPIRSASHPDQLELPFIKRLAPSSRSRLVTVPKSSTSRRTITVEPMLNQFVQQMLRTQLLDAISSCRIMSVCLDLSDQTKNQILAREGSMHNNFSTLDLKSASDLLSLDLVQKIFHRHGDFYRRMMESRSICVEHENVRCHIKKFGGMGNALTFPVQSIVFAVVSIAALLVGREKYPTYRNVLAAARMLRIYGDDIIVVTKHYRHVVRGLTSVGLKVNSSKSFFEGDFKESCGTDWFRGVEITPLYLRSVPLNLQSDPRALTNLVSACNQGWLRCYYKFSDHLKDIIEGYLRKKLPLTKSSSGSLGLHTRQEVSEYKRYNQRLNRFEFFGPVVRSRQKRDRLDGYGALMKFFHTPLVGRMPGHLERSPTRYRTKVSWRWVAY